MSLLLAVTDELRRGFFGRSDTAELGKWGPEAETNEQAEERRREKLDKAKPEDDFSPRIWFGLTGGYREDYRFL